MEEKNNTSQNEAKKIATHRQEFVDKVGRYLPNSLPEEVLILRAQLITEYYVNSLLAYTLPPEEGILYSGEKKKFSEKIEKIREVKLLLPNEAEAISRLNRLRNKFAHDIDYKVSEGDLDYIGFCFAKKYLEEKYATDQNGGRKEKRERLWFLLLDIVLLPALKFLFLVSKGAV